jgi:YD repeat-containing protein
VTGGSTVTTSYAYNDAGLLSKSDSDVLDEVTNYSWDDAGRLVKEETGDHSNEMSWNPDNSLAGRPPKTSAAKATATKNQLIQNQKNQAAAEADLKKAQEKLEEEFDWNGHA